MSRRLITVIGGLPAALGCVLGYLLVCSTLLAILFVGGLLLTASCWIVCMWATQGMVSRKDLPEARLRALRRSPPEPTHDQACVLCDEVLPDDSWLVGPRNSALVGYFEWKHDVYEMERRMHERVFPDGWERGAMLQPTRDSATNGIPQYHCPCGAAWGQAHPGPVKCRKCGQHLMPDPGTGGRHTNDMFTFEDYLARAVERTTP
jgi:hypothetical protein